MRQLKLYKRTPKFITKLPPKQQRQVAIAVQKLATEVTPHDAKKLQNSDWWRIDIGEYRAIYRWDDVAVHVVLVGKRNDSDVYRKLERM